MKKTLIAILAALVALIACRQTGPDEPGILEEGELLTLTAESSPVTRTSIDDALHLLWSPGDFISVFGSLTVPAGATVRLVAALWMYSKQTASTYELDYSTDGTNWTKIEDYTFTAASTNGTAEGSLFDINQAVKLDAAATSVFFRFLATNNVGPDGTDPNASGQIRLRSNKAENELAIYID